MKIEEATNEELHNRDIAPIRRRSGGRFTLPFAALLGGLALCLSTLGCEEQSAMDEAIEEVQDEAEDAERNIRDEIDDHT